MVWPYDNFFSSNLGNIKKLKYKYMTEITICYAKSFVFFQYSTFFTIHNYFNYAILRRK